MRWRSPRVLATTIVATAMAVTIWIPPASAASAHAALAHPAPAHPAPASAAPAAREQLLINGDRLIPGTRTQAIIPAGTTEAAQAATTLHLGGRTYVIPEVAFPYLGRGLDPSLFDVAQLPHTGTLPVTIAYRGAGAPKLPGVTITSTQAGSARGYLTAASAKAFGLALVRQFASDHGRASYGDDGLFGDGVDIALTGATTSSPGVRPQFPMHTLTVRGTNLAGQPDTGDYVSVYNSDNMEFFGDFSESLNIFDNGVAKFSVPTGHYWAIAEYTDVNAQGVPVASRYVLDPAFTVSGNTAISVSERSATSPVTVAVPHPAAPEFLQWSAYVTDPEGNVMDMAPSAFGAYPMYVNQTTRKMTPAKLQVYVTGTLASSSTATSPYVYDLGFAQLSGLIGPQRYTATAANLATLHARYFSDSESAGYLLRYPIFGTQTFSFNLVFAAPVNAPGQETEYLSAGTPAVYWESSYIASRSTLGGGQTDSTRTYSPGQQATEDWNAYPLHTPLDTSVLGKSDRLTTVLSASRAADTLSLNLSPFGDSTPGHYGAGFWPGDSVNGTGGITGSYEIDQNGVKIASGNADQSARGDGEFIKAVTLSPSRSTIRLTLNANRAVKPYVLSAVTSTVWTWRSQHESGTTIPNGWTCGNNTQKCDSEPLLTLNYDVAGLGLGGVAPAGAQVVRLQAGHQQLAANAAITKITAQVSFDGGAAWQPASVTGTGATRYAVFSAPAGSDVSLRVTATDSAGGAITETILRGYAVSAAASTAGYRPACAAPKSSQEGCLVLYSPQTALSRARAAGFTTAAITAPAGWGAKSIEAAYQLPVSKNPHQTIAVVDAMDTPKLATYLNAYRKEYGLPACTTANGCLSKVNEQGKSSPLAPNGTLSGWDLETTLDVDMVSAACPQCHILVVEANSASFADLAAAENTAARLGATVISNSYGARETGFSQAYASAYNHPGHTIVASSGDDGYTAASFPANLSTVTAAGGTELSIAHNGRGYFEQVWNSSEGAGSSGCSAYVSKPSWQHDPHCPGRTVADVSALAYDIAIYNTDYAKNGWLEVGGTSAASPLIAGVYGLAGNAATIKPGYEYAHPGSFFDVTSGNNDWFFQTGGKACGEDYLCVAKKGYDAPTGLGTPHGTSGF